MLFAAAVAGWAIVTGVTALVCLVQVILAGGVFYSFYMILAILLVASVSFLVAIPLSMGTGLLVLSVLRRLKLTASWQWALAGLLGGLIIASSLAIAPTPIAAMMTAPVVSLFAAAGAVAGVVAWREDRKMVAEA